MSELERALAAADDLHHDLSFDDHATQTEDGALEGPSGAREGYSPPKPFSGRSPQFVKQKVAQLKKDRRIKRSSPMGAFLDMPEKDAGDVSDAESVGSQDSHGSPGRDGSPERDGSPARGYDSDAGYDSQADDDGSVAGETDADGNPTKRRRRRRTSKHKVHHPGAPGLARQGSKPHLTRRPSSREDHGNRRPSSRHGRRRQTFHPIDIKHLLPMVGDLYEKKIQKDAAEAAHGTASKALAS